MKKILVTGCNGQLGRAIQEEYRGEVEFILTDVVEGEGIVSLDITNIDAVMALCNEKKPDVIINCAALTNVDGCEKTLELAYKINAVGPKNLAIAAEAVGAKIFHISTDYVFPGNGTVPYTEFDQPAPISAYGKSKYEGEKLVQQFSTRYFILRTAWLYGDGKNFVRTMLGLAEKYDEVSVVCDQIGNPTSAKELARLIHFLEPKDCYGIYHATCEGITSWADFTEYFYKKKGIKTKVNHVTSEQYKAMNPASADRPKYSCLDNMMLRLVSDDYRMKPWQEAIDEYLD